ncbi:MAG: mechanosensitive ion channel domain-containing protein [Cyclobacteriaceae bacterium]
MKRVLLLLALTLTTTLAPAQQNQADSIAQDTSDMAKMNAAADSINKVSADILQQGEKSKKKVSIKDGPPPISEIISFSKIFWAIVFMIIGYFVIKFTSRILEISAEKSTRYRITIKSFIPVVKIMGWISLIFIIIAGVFQPPAATILAFSASIGVAVGFASQDILKNIFGGVMILFDRPFKSGDKIEVGSHYGEVVEIGLRSTRIVTPDDSLVSIPNSEIMNKSVSNANSGESNCQVVAEIFLPIDADTAKVRTIATQAAQVSKYVFLNKPIGIVFANEFKDRESLLKMKIKAYVFDIRDEFKFKSEMTEIVLKNLIEEGIIKPKV